MTNASKQRQVWNAEKRQEIHFVLLQVKGHRLDYFREDTFFNLTDGVTGEVLNRKFLMTLSYLKDE